MPTIEVTYIEVEADIIMHYKHCTFGPNEREVFLVRFLKHARW